nr:MAG TPA_asm: restriction alleviation protein [Caudoviricetes sp.]
MSNLPVCPRCGMAPSIKIRSRGINWGSAEIRCSNGCTDHRAGFSFPPGSEAAARRELHERWEELISR